MSAEMSPRMDADLKEEEFQSCRESKAFSSYSAAEHADMLGQAVNDRYRCPEKFFDLGLSKQLPSILSS